MIRAFACAWLCGVIFSANATEQTYAGHPAAMAFAARWAADLPAINGDELLAYATKAAKEGILALQIHAGPPMVVQFRDVKIKKLP